jgi:hypothetical protein
VYFEAYFIKNVEVDQIKLGYAYTEKFHEHEKTQLKAYYSIVLKDVEEVFKDHNKLILPLLISMCFVSNLFVLLNSRASLYFDENGLICHVLRYATALDPKNQEASTSDMLLMQLTVLWFLIDFGVHITHFYVQNHLLQPSNDAFKTKLIKSLVLRFKFHQLTLTTTRDHFPKLMLDKLQQELAEIEDTKTKGLDLVYQVEPSFLKSITADSAHEQQKSPGSASSLSDKKEASNSVSSGGSSSGKTTSDDHHHVNFETYEFSPKTPIREKVMFIYYNKNKFAVGCGIRSLLFNIPRMSILFMILNLIYTQTAVDYFLTLVCIVFALQKPHLFIESNFMFCILYAFYFLWNWIMIRIDIPEFTLLKRSSEFLAPAGIPQYSGYILIMGVSIYSIGFLILIFWSHFSLGQLLKIKVDASKMYSLTTSDEYQVIDYKLWKKNSLSFINFIFKYIHTKLLELYALTIFLVCINIRGHIYFISIVLLIIFVIVLIDGLKSVKSMLKVFKFNSTTIGKQRFVPAARAIRVICWVAIVYENYDIFKKINIASEFEDLSPGVVLIYYLTLTVGDLLESLEYAHNRSKIEKEESIKAGFISLNYSYKLNEDKMIKRLHAFIGKSKLDAMGKQCATVKNINDVKLQLDYNKKLITDSLDEIYEEMFKMLPSFFQRFKRKLIYKMFTYMYKHTNTFRNEDLFVLYQIASKRNCCIRKAEELDLKAYFCHEYKQLEGTLREIQTYYDSHKELDESIIAKVNIKIEELRTCSNTRASAASIMKPKTLAELSNCDWASKDLFQMLKHLDHSPTLVAKNLKAAAEILYKAITVSQGINLTGVRLDQIKAHLMKKGLIIAKFGKQKIALFNVHEESFTQTHGYVVLKVRSFLNLLWNFCSSNSVVIVFWTIAVVSCINGSAFSVIILGILLFAVLIEETYGNLMWWRVLNILYLIKLITQMLSRERPGIAYFMMGGSIWLDIVQMVLTNVVMFQHKKTGFDDNHLMRIEDMGSCAVRLLVNDDFFNFIDRSLSTHQRMCNELSAYIVRKLEPEVSLDLLRGIKSTCTYLIVKLHHEIDTFKAEANTAAVQFFRRIKEDCYINTMGKSSEFLWRNFSIYSRKPGKDYSALNYISLNLILFFSILFLQTSETNRETLFNFQSDSQTIISALTVITITFYITLIFIERCFNNVRTNDSITIHYHTVFSSISREMFSEAKQSNPPIDRTDNSKFGKFKRAVRKAIILNMLKESKNSHKVYGSNFLFYKYIFLMIVWLLVSGLAFFVQPVFSDFNRKNLKERDYSSFLCHKDDPNCYSYRNLPITKIFYFLNILYFFFSIQQIRKGKENIIPQANDYSSIWSVIKYNIYYKTPVLREICTLIDYSVQLTSLELSDYLLCEDIHECIIKAKMLKRSSSEKTPGKLVPRFQRVFVSWIIIFALAILLVLPLILFSKFTTGNKEQEIISGRLSVKLYAGENRFLASLYESNLLLENRKLCKAN